MNKTVETSITVRPNGALEVLRVTTITDDDGDQQVKNWRCAIMPGDHSLADKVLGPDHAIVSAAWTPEKLTLARDETRALADEAQAERERLEKEQQALKLALEEKRNLQAELEAMV